MSTSVIKGLQAKAAQNPQKVVFPEADEAKIVKAAAIIRDAGIAIPILVGDEEVIEQLANQESVSLDGISVISSNDEITIGRYVELFLKDSQLFSSKKLHRMLKDPLYYAAMMVHAGDADAMVAGLSHATSDVILASQMIIGMQEGIDTPSSIFLMNVPNFEGSEGNLIVFADGGVCEQPTANELADIAITTADTVRALLGWKPRVAMLSYSTKGSAQHESIDTVLEALSIARQRKPGLCIDGEFQVDAAIVPEVAAKKVTEESAVAGKANILIFPDLNCGNIAYKLVQRFAKADAYGPFLQGFAKTVSDLSRGSSIDDIIGVTTMAVVRAQNLDYSTRELPSDGWDC